MIKVAFLTKNLAANGITSVLLNYGVHLDPGRFRLTVITGTPVEDLFRERFAKSEIDIVVLPSKRKNPVTYYIGLWRTLKKGYDIVHVHGNSATITAELLLSWLAGIPVRIAHCHNVTCDFVKIHKMLQPFMKRLCSYGFACSKDAGKWMFGDGSFEVLPNAFDTKKFVFDKEKRDEIRQSLGLDDAFVVGNVARFNDQKNHPYLLQIFEKVAEKRSDAVLLLVGNGPDLSKIQKAIEQHPYKDKIMYYGITDQVQALYAAMDVFVLPTKYEGLGIVFVEAQINGLPVVTTDCVPREVDISRHTTFLPLQAGPDAWSEAVLKNQKKEWERGQFYSNHLSAIQKYDIFHTVHRLEQVYQALLKQ